MTIAEQCDLILVAGGSSQRFKAPLPKQFEPINGRPLYLWSLDVFLSWSELGHAVLVVPADWVEPVKQSFNILKNTKQIHVVAGGSSRQVSAQKGLIKLDEVSRNKWVMIHDGARPAITEELVGRVWNGRTQTGSTLASGSEAASVQVGEIAGVIPGIPAFETVKTIYRHGETTLVRETLPRSELVIVQTPQLLERRSLAQAYKTMQGLDAVDDACLLEKMGLKIVVVDGDYDNVKVTFNEDKDRVSSWLRKRYP